MKAVGIIAEYNPLHNGHVYHIEQAKQLTGADAVIVAMSGNFVQRGEPAVFDKWTRTKHALGSGADLVVELPTLYCLGNAGQYANAGVKILESTGVVSHIAFGSESGNIGLLRNTADNLKLHSSQISDRIRDLRSNGLSYPAARELAYSEIVEEAPDVLKNSNDILALEYINAMDVAVPVAVKRVGAGYSESFDHKYDYQSATAIRQMINEGRDIGQYVPECVSKAASECHFTGVMKDNWFDLLRYAVLSTPAEIIEDCPSGGEGLANLMKKEIIQADNWDDFIMRIRSKRYTYTRLSRLCMQVILGITRTRYSSNGPGYIRILGFNNKGRALLAEMRDNETSVLPVLTNINKEQSTLTSESFALLELDRHASDIYNLSIGKKIALNSDNVHPPVNNDK